MTTGSIMYLLSIQLTLLIVINTVYSAYNHVAGSKSLNSEQLNHITADALQNSVHLVIQTRNGKHMNLKLEPTRKQSLANTNLPVWTADEYDVEFVTVTENRFNVTEAVGNFRTFHDVETNSAVVYFEKTQTFYGVIGSKYYILGLPLHFMNEIQRVGGKYVKKRIEGDHKTTEHITPSPTDTGFFPGHMMKRQVNPEQYNISHIQKHRSNTSEEHYVETLVFVTHDITRQFKKADPSSYLSKVVMNHIVFLNAVDMMFAKFELYDIKIHINLAGMVIENGKEIFERIMAYDYSDRNSGEIHNIPVVTIHDAFRQYLKHNHDSFAIDSLDLALVVSGRAMLIDYDVLGGMTYPMDMYATRTTSHPDKAIPMVAMRFKYHYDQYCVAAYEIAYALEIFHHPKGYNKRTRNVQCHGKKPEEGVSCLKCADWRPKQLEQLREFMRENRNRCFLLNYPTSLLHPDEAKTSLILPNQQCRCYGYDYKQSKIPADACAQPLQCNANDADDGRLVTTILPLDGTPCGTESVCWHKKCVNMYEQYKKLNYP